jgi:hypothetical protein
MEVRVGHLHGKLIANSLKGCYRGSVYVLKYTMKLVLGYELLCNLIHRQLMVPYRRSPRTTYVAVGILALP